MAIYTNSAEGGTNGATATNGSSGNTGGISGTYFDSVTAGITFSNVSPLLGTLSYAFDAGTFRQLRWDKSETGPSLMRAYFSVSDVSVGNVILTMTGSTAKLNLLSGANAGRLQLFMGSGRATSPVSPLLANNTKYRAQLWCVPGASGVGKLRAAVWLADDSTLFWDSGDVVITGATVNENTQYIYGKNDASTDTAKFDGIGLRTSTDAATWIDWPVAANVAPSVVPGATQYVDPGVVNLIASGTDDGTFASGTWTILSGPDSPTVGSTSNTGIGTASNTATASFTANPGVYICRCTMTDNGGATGSGDTTIYVAALSSGDVLPIAEIAGTWTKVGAASNRITTITDALLTTYLQSANDPVNDTERLRLGPFRPGPLSHFPTFDQDPDTPVVTWTVNTYKEDGTTLIHTQTVNAPLVPTEVEIALSGAALTAITGADDAATRVLRRALIVDVIANQP